MRLTLESESIGRTGGITGAGAKKVIGAPHIDSLEVVIREALQNSWDAAVGRSIGFGIVGYEFTGARKTALREALYEGTNRKTPVITLPDGPLDALLLWDKGTSGLGGSLRPDEHDDSKRDFVRFVYMIGDTKARTDAFAKGGTYGFGRSSFLNASKAGTILIHTACKHGGVKQSRFIGMSWTDPKLMENSRFTGRHWWGDRDGRHVLPILDNSADRMSHSLGMDVISTGELGTAVLILFPRWSSTGEDASVERARALSQIRNGLLWNCWPRLLDGTIKVTINWFGQDVLLPDPRNEPRLKLFTRAFDALEVASPPANSTRLTLECKKPIKTLGTLVLTKAPFHADSPSGNFESEDEHDERDASHPLRHVAMMRGTRLVIHYFEGPMPPEGQQYAGVFLADKGVDGVYADSEPPAHDDWVKENLTGQNRTIVNVTYRRVHDSVRDFLQQAGSHQPSAHPADFGLLAEQLGGLFTGVEGDGRGGHDRGGGGGAENKIVNRKRANVQVSSAELHPHGDELELRIPVNVHFKGKQSQSVTLSARAVVLVEGGTEKQLPEGAKVPKVRGWQLAPDAPIVEGASIHLEAGAEQDIVLYVLQPRDCSVKIVVEAE